MLQRLYIMLLLAYSGVASAATPGQIDLQAETNNTVYSDELSGFAVNKSGAISLLVGKSPKSDARSAIGTYLYETTAGKSRIDVISSQSRTLDSTQASQRGSFVAQAVYGETMWIPAYSLAPPGWGAISGNYPGPILVKYLLGARYGATEYLDTQFGIPLHWVRTGPSPSGNRYQRYMYVLGAPFGAEIYADSSFPIPAYWLRVAGGFGYGTYRNYAGAPSGTQWYIDVTWGIPVGWTYVGQGYPYRWARKN